MRYVDEFHYDATSLGRFESLTVSPQAHCSGVNKCNYGTFIYI